MAKDRAQYLIKNTVIFTIGNFGAKLISFFLIPLYTNALTTEQYGIVDLVATVSTVAVPILTLNIAEAILRFALDKDANQKKIIQIGTDLLIVGSVLGLLIIPICRCFAKLSDYAALTYVYVIAAAFSQIYLSDLRGKELLVQYSVGNILNTFLIAVFNILFLLVFKQGIEGYLTAYILANIITGIYAVIVGKSLAGYHFFGIKRRLAKEMVKYSVALIPNTFMWWIMNSSDRIMVSGMVSVAANGIYAISYKLPTMVSTITGIFNQAWSYSAIKEMDSKDETEYNNQILKLLTCTVMIVGIAILTITKPFLKVYVSKSYYEAWKYVPFLIVGSVYMTLGTFFGTSYSVHKDSVGYVVSGFSGAILNVILNYFLIPKWQVYGAAFATCVSYVTVFIYRYFNTQKYLKYNLHTSEFIVGSILLILSSVMIYVDTTVGLISQWVILGAALLFYRKDLIPLLKKLISVVKAKRTGK